MRSVYAALLLLAATSPLAAQTPSTAARKPVTHKTAPANPAAVHHSAIVIDTHADTPQRFVDDHCELHRPPQRRLCSTSPPRSKATSARSSSPSGSSPNHLRRPLRPPHPRPHRHRPANRPPNIPTRSMLAYSPDDIDRRPSRAQIRRRSWASKAATPSKILSASSATTTASASAT